MRAEDPVTSSLRPAVLFPSSQVAPESPVDVDARARHHLAPLAVNLAYVSTPRPTAAARIDRPECPHVVACRMDSTTAQHHLDQCRYDAVTTSTSADCESATWAL